MDVGEILTGGRVSWHDGFIHVAASCSPVISGSFGCARLRLACLMLRAFVEGFGGLSCWSGMLS